MSLHTTTVVTRELAHIEGYIFLPALSAFAFQIENIGQK